MTSSGIVVPSPAVLRFVIATSFVVVMLVQLPRLTFGQENLLAEQFYHLTEPDKEEVRTDRQHPQRAPILSPDEDRAYSELNHRIAGIFVLFAGGLALLSTIDNRRYAWARYGWPGLFCLLGVFLFVRHDPESWPWGPLPLWESLRDPQVLQHVLFTCIVLAIGVIEWLRCGKKLSQPLWGLLFPTLAISGAVMLLLHKHGSGPEAEKVYRHYVLMAVAGIVAMIAKVLDDSRLLRTRLAAYVWPSLVMLIGILLLFYPK